MKLACIQASRSGSACLAMISSSGSGRATARVTSEISRTGSPSYRLGTPLATIRPAAASHASPMVSERRICGSPEASRVVITAW